MTAIGLVLIIFSLWFIWVTDNNTSGATIASQSNTGGNMYLKELIETLESHPNHDTVLTYDKESGRFETLNTVYVPMK